MDLNRQILDKYLEADAAEKVAKDIKDKLRKEVITILQVEKHDDIMISTREKVDLIDDPLKDWLKTQLTPAAFDQVLKTVVDLEVLEIYQKTGIVDTSKMPSDCYKLTAITAITKPRK